MFVTPNAEDEKRQIALMARLQEAAEGSPIELLAPMLVVMTARLLVDDAKNDAEKLAHSVFKFVGLLTETVNEMIEEEGFGVPRQ
jgi:hypothetical protein